MKGDAQRKYFWVKKYGTAVGMLFHHAAQMRFGGKATPSEKKIWKALKKLQKRRKIRRPYSQVAMFRKNPWFGVIYDFSISGLDILIEIDGSHHNDEYDRKKNDFAVERGFRVLHIPNDFTQGQGLQERLLREIKDFDASGEQVRYL